MGGESNYYKSRANLPSAPNGLPNNLEDMTTVELAEAMEKALEGMTETNYDETVIDAYLEELESRSPSPEFSDVDEAYTNFQKILQESIVETSPHTAMSAKQPIQLPRLLRTGLVAIITVVCVLGGMLTVQASGIDVFGTMARWTEYVFRFGGVPDNGAVDVLHSENIEGTFLPLPNITEKTEFESIQAALDKYGISEVIAPTWWPEGYVLSELFVLNYPDPDTFVLNAVYKKEGEDVNIGFDVMQYTGLSTNQVEKTVDPVSIVQIKGNTVYVVKNNRNYTASWITEHYECYLSATDKDDLFQMLYSMGN